MNKLLAIILVAAAGFVAYYRTASSGGPDLTINGNEVLLATHDLDVRFTRTDGFGDTYMLFGGTYLEHVNAIGNVFLAGLSIREARPIHRRHPDFHLCASPGASLAKKAVEDIDVVPTDGRVLRELRSTLDDFEASIRSGGDRVCVALRGSELVMTDAEIREIHESVKDKFPRQNYRLVESVERVDCKQALTGA